MIKRTWFITFLLGAALPLCAAPGADWKVLSHYEKAPIKKQLTDRLTNYVKFDTQSKPTAKASSSSGQLQFAKALAKELKKNGAIHVIVDKSALVTAEVPSNLGRPTPTIALAAHLDTTPGLSGNNIHPQIHTLYKGGDIVLNAQKKLVLNSHNSPQLARAKGHDIITASGDTVLGADGKAGIAIILTLVQYLYDHPQLPHGTLKIIFTPDSTNGLALPASNLAGSQADHTYTLDGGALGELNDETFNAKSFVAVFEGDRTGPLGEALSSSFADNVLMASDFHTLLPRHKRPETTANKNGFIFVDNIVTRKNRTEVTGLLRAFSDQEMQTLVNEVTQSFHTVKNMNLKGKNFSLTFTDQYVNIQKAISPKTLQLAQEAMRAEEITPQRTAARKKTTGTQLYASGIAAPGLFTGSYNTGSLLEYADVDVMEAAFRTVLRILSLQTLPPTAPL